MFTNNLASLSNNNDGNKILTHIAPQRNSFFFFKSCALQELSARLFPNYGATGQNCNTRIKKGRIYYFWFNAASTIIPIFIRGINIII